MSQLDLFAPEAPPPPPVVTVTAPALPETRLERCRRLVPRHLLCFHGVNVKKDGHGWRYMDSGPYAGYWVHSDPTCMKPAWIRIGDEDA